MNEVFILFLCGITGSILGAFFFIGLWWTVCIGLSTKNPGVLFVVSQLVRTSTVVAGFYFLSHSEWQRLVCGLLGFLISRQWIKSRIQHGNFRAT